MSDHDHGYDKDAIGKRLRRIEGQVRGIEKMVDEERYCIDILTQIGAAMTALESVGLKVLDDHVNHCVADAIASGDEAEAAREDGRAARRRAALRENALARGGASGARTGDQPGGEARQKCLDEREEPVPARHEDLTFARLDGACDSFGNRSGVITIRRKKALRSTAFCGIPRFRRSPAARCAP